MVERRPAGGLALNLPEDESTTGSFVTTRGPTPTERRETAGVSVFSVVSLG